MKISRNRLRIGTKRGDHTDTGSNIPRGTTPAGDDNIVSTMPYGPYEEINNIEVGAHSIPTYLTVVDRPKPRISDSGYLRPAFADGYLTPSELKSQYIDTGAVSESEYVRSDQLYANNNTPGADLSLGSGAGAQAACPPTGPDSPDVIEFDSVYLHTIGPDSVLYNANAGRGAEEARDSLHLA